MTDEYLRLSLKAQAFWAAIREERGQDLVEYAAVISLVVLALTAGMTAMANGINNAMTSVSTAINSTIG